MAEFDKQRQVVFSIEKELTDPNHLVPVNITEHREDLLDFFLLCKGESFMSVKDYGDKLVVKFFTSELESVH